MAEDRFEELLAPLQQLQKARIRQILVPSIIENELELRNVVVGITRQGQEASAFLSEEFGLTKIDASSLAGLLIPQTNDLPGKPSNSISISDILSMFTLDY